jgi:hypothetical protein
MKVATGSGVREYAASRKCFEHARRSRPNHGHDQIRLSLTTEMSYTEAVAAVASVRNL